MICLDCIKNSAERERKQFMCDPVPSLRFQAQKFDAVDRAICQKLKDVFRAFADVLQPINSQDTIALKSNSGNRFA